MMPTMLVLAVIISTIIFIALIAFYFIRQSKGKQNVADIDFAEFEESVIDLVSKFQHISATRLSSLENKLDEMNKLLKESNEIYLKLTSVMSDAAKRKTELEALLNRADQSKITGEDTREPHVEVRKKESDETISEENEPKTDKPIEEKPDIAEKFDPRKNTESREEEVENPFDLKSSSIEHKIMNLSSEGLDSNDIAKELGVGKGEVELVLELFKRKYS